MIGCDARHVVCCCSFVPQGESSLRGEEYCKFIYYYRRQPRATTLCCFCCRSLRNVYSIVDQISCRLASQLHSFSHSVCRQHQDDLNIVQLTICCCCCCHVEELIDWQFTELRQSNKNELTCAQLRRRGEMLLRYNRLSVTFACLLLPWCCGY